MGLSGGTTRTRRHQNSDVLHCEPSHSSEIALAKVDMTWPSLWRSGG